VITQEIEISEPEELIASATDINNDTGTANGSVTLESVGGVGPFEYSLDGVNFTSNPLFENLMFGDYEGFVQDANGCISQTTFTIDMETSIINIESGINSIDIIPNPFSEYLLLNVDLEKAQNLNLQMWTIVGQRVFEKTIHLQKGIHSINLEANQQLPAATYFLQIKNEEGNIGYFKLIKQ